jgi:hypothetical protein
MKKNILFLLPVLLFLCGCEKSIDSSNKGTFTVTPTGCSTLTAKYVGSAGSYEKNTFTLDYSNRPGSNGILPQTSFNFQAYFDSSNESQLILRISEPIVVGKVYSSLMTTHQVVFSGDFSCTASSGGISKTEVIFTKVNQPGIIAGTFKVYWPLNGPITFSGTFEVNIPE